MNQLAKLTPAERRVFDRVIDGQRNKQIAHELGVTERTVKAHRKSIMGKLGVTSIAALVKLAIRLEAPP